MTAGRSPSDRACSCTNVRFAHDVGQPEDAPLDPGAQHPGDLGVWIGRLPEGVHEPRWWIDLDGVGDRVPHPTLGLVEQAFIPEQEPLALPFDRAVLHCSPLRAGVAPAKPSTTRWLSIEGQAEAHEGDRRSCGRTTSEGAGHSPW